MRQRIRYLRAARATGGKFTLLAEAQPYTKFLRKNENSDSSRE